jgi:outer membrane receptor for ferrienterochelin and colicin
MIDLAPLFISILLRVVEPTQRPRIVETVSVTGSATSIVTPAAVTALDREDLSGSPAGTLDDALRAIPGFSLFRRSSSRVANPTTQGATLCRSTTRWGDGCIGTACRWWRSTR